jgi:hypothetical protein
VKRLAKASTCSLALLIHAPLQCSHDPDPSVRTEDTAGDALWDLSKDFQARGDHVAAQHTLEVLVSRYPSSRHAPAAKEMLGGDAGGLPR